MTGTWRWLEGARSVAELGKPAVSLLAAFSALAASFLASAELEWRLLLPWVGVFLLACGAGALNQYQERESDGRMERTRGRPLPSGRVRPGAALAAAAALIVLGLLVLAAGGRTPVLLGGLAIAWYNGVYTPLKRATAYAAIPGALTGAFPPAIGWIFAGGRASDPRMFAICLVLFVWQVPHFWLVALDRGPEYERAGLPRPTARLRPDQLRRIVCHWVVATAACSLLLSLGSVFSVPATRYAVWGLSLWLAIQAAVFGFGPRRAGAVLFRRLNLYMAGLLALACTDRLLAVLGVL